MTRCSSLGKKSQEVVCENDAYLTRQLITYIGNKRALLHFIERGVKKICGRLNKDKLVMFDVFSGSGIVARFFKRFSDLLIVNDIEKYSMVINQCYLSNMNESDLLKINYYYTEIMGELSRNKLEGGMISSLYAPKCDDDIQPDERVFYTTRNAMYIDTVRKLIGYAPLDYQKYFLAPLLSEASIHANTSGIFKGFYKNKETGLGQFGGKNQDALFRIKGDINLPFPVFSNFHSDLMILGGDANKIINDIPEVDVAYLDPPYNQHPYGSNYFMLNLILDYKYPSNASRISGIPDNWNRSDYNKEKLAYGALKELVTGIKAKYILISFNSEGFIGVEDLKKMLTELGRLEILETRYNTFRGSRNLNGREIHVKEYLYLLEK
ncbi:MAG: DNA adenine methylase [Spirochaetaceae bacterium]|jgi:adenine-specific DNA-methyltransferase|nr:DNA adenine methylase [Spirochaetaceae bacterium]